MSFDEFVAFVDTRPDEEKWELLEGHVVMSPSPASPHQRIVVNLAYFFERHRRQANPAWIVLPTFRCMSPRSLSACRSPTC
jgi:hypothetical protein